MKKLQSILFLLLCCQIFWVTALMKITKICVTSGFEEQCDRITRETQNVKCVRVQDSIECAKLLRNGSSGFGVFSAESTLLLAALNYDGLTVLKELRHRDRLNYTSDFESVVVVKATHKNGVDGLKGLNYCHPGFYYDHAERWSERFLKHFERSVTTLECEINSTKSPAEIETAAVASYFGSACRPGAWSNNIQEDERLKIKYPQLCELCTSKTSKCEYEEYKNRHIEALNCLLDKGEVAYVSSQDAVDFFSPLSEHSQRRSEFAYLCPDDTLQLINDFSRTPCTWLRQPWPVVISSNADSITLSENINRWIYMTLGWEGAVREILTADDLTPLKTTIQKPRDIFFPYREVPYVQPLCSTQVTWCTKSLEEKEKCEIIRTAGITTGIYPLIECQEPVAGAISCLKEVSEGRASFTLIDGNLGYVAREPYKLTTALYSESSKTVSAAIVVHANSKYTKIQDLKDANACIGEFNGIASVAFIDAGKRLKVLNRHCNNSKLLSEFFGSSCAPGAQDTAYNINDRRDNLCSLCPKIGSGAVSVVRPSTENPLEVNLTPLNVDVELTGSSNLENELDVLNKETKLNCNADRTNSYFGDLGALFCLQNAGEVAILGLKDINENVKTLGINPNNYQIICKNGSLAAQTGFDVDSDCTLGSFIDSEIVIKPNNPQKEGIINAILSIDKYFQRDPDFKVYHSFDGHKDLLFNDGTTSFNALNVDEPSEQYSNYKKLFDSIYACGGAFKSIPSESIVIVTVLFTLILNRILQV